MHAQFPLEYISFSLVGVGVLREMMESCLVCEQKMGYCQNGSQYINICLVYGFSRICVNASFIYRTFTMTKMLHNEFKNKQDKQKK